MSQIMKADIFFVVSTVSVVVVSVLIIVAILYLIGILRDARKLSSRVREEGEEIVNDVGNIRKKTITGLSRIINSFIKKSSKKTKHEKSN